jgi:hypothetical protein
MSKKASQSNIAEWQVRRQNKRKAFIEQAIELSRGHSFDSYNQFATYLAKRLTEYEKLEARHRNDVASQDDESLEFVPPRAVSRQIFYTNKIYRAIAEAAYTGRIIEGADSITNPKTVSEFNTILTQKDFEISNLKDDIEKLKAQIKAEKKYTSEDMIFGDEDSIYQSMRKEKALTTQALITLIRWGKGLIKYTDGQIIDIAEEGPKRILVKRDLLKHCAPVIENALNGFTCDE